MVAIRKDPMMYCCLYTSTGITDTPTGHESNCQPASGSCKCRSEMFYSTKIKVILNTSTRRVRSVIMPFKCRSLEFRRHTRGKRLDSTQGNPGEHNKGFIVRCSYYIPLGWRCGCFRCDQNQNWKAKHFMSSSNTQDLPAGIFAERMPCEAESRIKLIGEYHFISHCALLQ